MSLIRPNRRDLLKYGALGASALALPRMAAAQSAVNFQLSWTHSVQFGGAYMAMSNGYWDEAGISVSLQPGGPNAPVEPPVIAGTALVGIAATDYTAAAVEQGAPLKIIGHSMQNSPFAVASLPDNPVAEPADLIGKRIGLATSNTPVLEALCTINGIDINEIELVPTQYDAAPLINGQVECLLAWTTDLPVAMTIQGVDNVVMPLADFGYELSQIYITTDEALETRREELIALLTGETRGWADYEADPAAAAQVTMDMFPDSGLDLETQLLQAER
ncbi:MAG: ABC transporter substrate-binding protein, partial [Pseudomonadota bacterium]